MGKYLKQGFVRKLEWQLAREEISHSKMVELMEEECIKNYKAETFNTKEKCTCKSAQFTREVTEDFEPMCGRCGRPI